VAGYGAVIGLTVNGIVMKSPVVVMIVVAQRQTVILLEEDKENSTMSRFNLLKSMLLFIIVGMSMYCEDDDININNSRQRPTINDCFEKDDREGCFEKFFSWDGPVINGPESEHGKLIKIKDPKHITILCEELRKTTNTRLASALFIVAVFNNAPCVCDYAILEYEKSVEGDGIKEYYGNYLNILNCGYDVINQDHDIEPDRKRKSEVRTLDN
jgi:hypothetical protein